MDRTQVISTYKGPLQDHYKSRSLDIGRTLKSVSDVPLHALTSTIGSEKFQKLKFIFWNFSDPFVEVNAVVRHFRQPWVLIRKIWQ